MRFTPGWVSAAKIVDSQHLLDNNCGMKTPDSPAAMTATANLVDFLTGARSASLSDEVIEKTKRHLVDTVAAMVSGARLPVGLRALDVVPALGGPAQALVIGSPTRLPAYLAAMINAMLAHADETDDSHERSKFHPGCGIIPAALALAQQQHASGRDAIRAIALGYDVAARTLEALGPMPLNQAGHASHAIGPLFGCGAVAADLLAFDAVQARNLLSYLGHEASGLACWMSDVDHIQKAYVFGAMGAKNALLAAVLCQHGWTGNVEILEGERRLLHAFEQPEHGRSLSEPFELGAEILHSDIKKWCVGSPIQAPLDCIEFLMDRIPADPASIREVEVEIQANEAFIVQTRNIANISLQHLVALLLVDRQLTFESVHDDARMHDPAILALRQRVRLIPSEALQKAGGRQGIVRIHLTDGSILTHHVVRVRGTWENPMSREEIDAKAADLMAPVLGAPATRRLLDGLWAFETLDAAAIDPLFEGLSAI